MKLFTLSIILWIAAQSYSLPFAHASSPADLAEQWLTSTQQHAWTQASQNYDAAMQMALPPETLQNMWLQMEQLYGPLESYAMADIFPFAGYTIVNIHCHFPKQSVTARISVDAQNHIGGVQFVPYQPTAARAEPPPAQASIAEEPLPLTFPDRGDLPGTLTRPANASDVLVILVHGSGAHDQDETIGPNKPFQDLAHGLAARDIAVYRFDKRSLAHPQEFSAEYDYTVEEEVIADARAAVAALQPQFKHIFLLGHSLGGTLAPRIAQGASAVDGLIILAGSTRSFEDLLLEQTRTVLRSDGEWSPEDDAAYQTVTAQAETLRTLTPESALSAAELPFGIPASYWLDFKAYDPVRTAASLSRPMLILQGERDYQVTMEDFSIWRRGLTAFGHIRLKSYPSLNHLFMPGSGPSTPQEYFTKGTVDNTVIDDIAGWIKENLRN